MTNTDYNFNRLPNENKFQHLVRVCVDKLNKLHNKDWLEIKDEFNFEHSAESLRKYATGWKILVENEYLEDSDSPIGNEPIIKYKEATEILGDGSQKSDKLISMSLEQSKDVNYLLQAHGFDTKEWDLVSARNNIWNTNSQSQGVQTLYSSKITVKPKVIGFNVDKFIERVKQEVKPIHIKSKVDKGERLLEIPLFDMHFGIADLDYYLDTYNEILETIESRKWDTILFVIGQDLLHNDGFEGKTTNGTFIQKVDMEKAWDDAFTFYENLISKAIKNAANVHAIYSAGNHDRAISFGFAKALAQRFPQVKFDTGIKHRKHFVWNDIALFFTHGDKGHNRMSRNFLDEYGKIIANAKVVEIHSGHLHAEKAKDDFGILVRTLSTGAKTDDWHYEQGFIGSEKRFQLFEFTNDKLKKLHYI